MTTDRFQRFLPLAGVIAGLAMIAGLLLSGSSPASDASAAKVAAYYSDHDGALVVSAICAQVFAVMLIFFTAGLRSVIRSGEAGEASYSTVVTIGGAVTAIAMSLSGMTILAAVDAATGDAAPSVVQSLHALSSFTWMPWAVGAGALMIAAGLGGLRTLALPRALSWASLVLGVVALTPAGILAFFATPIWLIATGVVLMRGSRTTHAIVAQPSGA
jgi:hypothetical protein